MAFHQRHSMSPVERPRTPLYGLYVSPATLSWSTLSAEYVYDEIANRIWSACAIRGAGVLRIHEHDDHCEGQNAQATHDAVNDPLRVQLLPGPTLAISHLSTRRFGSNPHDMPPDIPAPIPSPPITLPPAPRTTSHLTPPACSPRYSSTTSASIGRVVSREVRIMSSVPVSRSSLDRDQMMGERGTHLRSPRGRCGVSPQTGLGCCLCLRVWWRWQLGRSGNRRG